MTGVQTCALPICHAIRSKAILTELVKKHDVKVVAGGRAAAFLSKFFDVSKIGFFRILYRNNAVSNSLTFFHNLLKFPFVWLYNLKVIWIMFKFKPEVVITDFEPFSCYAALLFGKKCISVDNQHIINCKLKAKWSFDRFVSWLIIKSITLKADYYLVTTFFYPPVKKKRTYLFPPINREGIINAKPKKGNHILVYQTSESNKRLVPVLKNIKDKFIVYGLNKDKNLGNVTLRKFSENGFINDLTNAKGVICNGGFTTLGESLYLMKPVLSIPEIGRASCRERV